jgi:hypothetical protein
MSATFVARWRRHVYESDLPAPPKLVGLALSEYADYRTGRNAYPGNRRLMGMTSYTEPTVIKALENLESVGFVKVVLKGGSKARGKRLASNYSLTIPGDDHLRRFSGQDSPGTARPLKDVCQTTKGRLVHPPGPAAASQTAAAGAASAAPGPGSPKVIDELDNALRRECKSYFATMGDDQRAEYDDAVRQLVRKRAKPDEIPERAHNSRQWYPAAPVTPIWLAAEWADLR